LLVVAEPGVAVDAEERLLPRGVELGGDGAEVLRQLLDDLDHRAADVRLVLIFPGAEPLAIVVALERSEERQRPGGERRGETGHAPISPRLATCPSCRSALWPAGSAPLAASS